MTQVYTGHVKLDIPLGWRFLGETRSFLFLPRPVSAERLPERETRCKLHRTVFQEIRGDGLKCLFCPHAYYVCFVSRRLAQLDTSPSGFDFKHHLLAMSFRKQRRYFWTIGVCGGPHDVQRNIRGGCFTSHHPRWLTTKRVQHGVV